MALASLYICMDSPERSLLDNAINSKISCACSNDDRVWQN